MSLTGDFDLSLTSKTNRLNGLIDRLCRRVAALEAPTVIIWALTPFVVAALAAIG